MKTVGRMERWDINRMPAFSDPSDHQAGEQALLQPPMQNTPTALSGPPIRLGVMASGNGSNFEALATAIKAGLLHAEIVLLVVNNPGCGATTRAERLQIPYAVVDHRVWANREELDEELVRTFKDVNVDAVVMAGWMRIVTPVLICAFTGRLLNIHPSLLPSFRGLDAIGQALRAGVCISGCTVHLVSEELDAGPIIAQAAVPVLKSDDHDSLAARIHRQEHRLLPHAVQLAATRWTQG